MLAHLLVVSEVGRRIQKSDQILYNHALFRALAYLEAQASSDQVCRTCKMIMDIQSSGIVRTVYWSIFKNI